VNLGQLRTALDRLTGVGMDATAQTEWVNAAVQAIASERRWPWLDGTASITTVDGTASYALPADWQATRGVSANGNNYTPVSVRSGDGTWDDWQDDVSYGFAVEGTNLIIYPTPAVSGDTITHRYVKTEPALSADGDEPILPARFHWAIVHYAAALIFDRMGQMPQAAAQRAEYEKWRARMLDDLSRTRGPHRIRVRPGSVL
jgi:hypothetical protein